ncbi:MAG: LytTR family DNA-binding domain-containing protein [Oscillospiraceae bacterium]|nr:LytTR family DNA-binding domain-containing protein [Oscillospiraceae bacterium]
MYRIAVCEDEKVFSEEHERVCRGVLEKLNIEFRISVFETGAAFWTAFSGGERYDLLLLDIMMDDRRGAGANVRCGGDAGMDGVELARRIRGQDAAAAIIFITSTAEYAIDGYGVGALHYLMKPLDAGALERLIASDYKKRAKDQRLVFKSGRQNLNIPMDEVVCLETAGKRVAITLLGETLDCSGNLLELLKGREQLIRCHKSFAVNVRNLRELTRTDAVAANGKVIPVSRTYFKDVQRAFLKQIRQGQ